MQAFPKKIYNQSCIHFSFRRHSNLQVKQVLFFTVNKVANQLAFINLDLQVYEY